MDKTLRIGEIADFFDIPASTLRYWEEKDNAGRTPAIISGKTHRSAFLQSAGGFISVRDCTLTETN